MSSANGARAQSCTWDRSKQSVGSKQPCGKSSATHNLRECLVNDKSRATGICSQNSSANGLLQAYVDILIEENKSLRLRDQEWQSRDSQWEAVYNELRVDYGRLAATCDRWKSQLGTLHLNMEMYELTNVSHFKHHMSAVYAKPTSASGLGKRKKDGSAAISMMPPIFTNQSDLGFQN